MKKKKFADNQKITEADFYMLFSDLYFSLIIFFSLFNSS